MKIAARWMLLDESLVLVACLLGSSEHYVPAMRKRRVFLILLGLMLAGVIVLLSRREREPEYGGKRLTEWVERANWRISTNSYQSVVGSNSFSMSPLFGGYERQGSHDIWVETKYAIKQIGPAALPYLLKWIRYEPSGWEGKMLGVIDSLFGSRLRDRRSLRAGGGTAAIIALGPGAEAAIPALARLANNDQTPIAANHATWILLSLGKDFLAADIALMRNHSADLRRQGIRMSSMVFREQIGPAVPALAHCLRDDDEGIAVSAAELLGNGALDAELVVPALANGLKDQRPEVLRAVMSALLHFPIKKARIAVPALLALLKNPDPEVNRPAGDILEIIDPKAGKRNSAQ